MKKIFTLAVLLLGAVSFFSACEDDNDSNPVLTGATEFVLNTPAYSGEVLDLQHSESVHFTFSQPDYGFPVVTNYYYQISKDGQFTTSVAQAEADETGTAVADYVQSTSYTTQCVADYSAEDFERTCSVFSSGKRMPCLHSRKSTYASGLRFLSAMALLLLWPVSLRMR